MIIFFRVPKSGFLHKSDTLENPAKQCGIDSDGLTAEVKKFN